MALAWFNGGMPTAVACTSRISAVSLQRPTSSCSSSFFFGRAVSTETRMSRRPTSSCKSVSLRSIGSNRVMRPRAIADAEFPERDVEPSEALLPRSTHIAGDSRSSNVMSTAISQVLPDFKFLHATAIVHPDAIIGEGVVIGAFCTVGPGAKLGYGCKLHPNSHICGNTELGERCEVMIGAVIGADIPGRTVIGHHNTIGYHAVVGVKCQDMKYKEGDECYLYIGNNNDVREYASIHRSSKPNDDTVIGSDNLIMGSCHIAHDCKLGNHNILANGTLLGGHVVLEDYVHTGGAVAVHQFCHVDSYSFLAGGSMVDRDVPMYMMVAGDRAELRGLNLEGMRRCGFSDLEVRSIRRTYQKLFMNSDSDAGGLEDRLSDLRGYDLTLPRTESALNAFVCEPSAGLGTHNGLFFLREPQVERISEKNVGYWGCWLAGDE